MNLRWKFENLIPFNYIMGIKGDPPPPIPWTWPGNSPRSQPYQPDQPVVNAPLIRLAISWGVWRVKPWAGFFQVSFWSSKWRSRFTPERVTDKTPKKGHWEEPWGEFFPFPLIIPPLKFNIAPENGSSQKERLVFQPPFFSCCHPRVRPPAASCRNAKELWHVDPKKQGRKDANSIDTT